MAQDVIANRPVTTPGRLAHRLDLLRRSSPWKDPVRAVAPGNITLSGEQTVDGVALITGDLVLTPNQTDQTARRLWRVEQNAWRAPRIADEPDTLPAGTKVTVQEGATYAGTTWRLTTTGTIVLGTTALAWVNDSAAAIPESQVTNLTTDLAAKAPLASPTFTGTSTLPAVVIGTRTITTTATLTATDNIVLADTSGGSYTATLPAATGQAGREIGLRKTTADANTLTVACNGAETIQGLATQILRRQYDYLLLRSDGSNWLVVARSVDIQAFTASGTWVKPAGCQTTTVHLIAGGGGGGSGYKGAAGTARVGGGGGGAGAYAWEELPTTVLGATETVTVGTGGTGGAAQTVNTTNGNNGNNGNVSTFGAWIRAAAGGLGTGGQLGGGGSAGNAGVGPASGGAGVAASTTGAAGSAASGNSVRAGAGGGSGGGISAADAASAGGAGGAQNSTGTIRNGGTAGAIGTAGSAPAVVSGALEPIGGPGGGGGGSSITGNAGAGGNGGSYGSGGGGGGAALNSTGNSGAGGNGADGFCLVISR